MSEALEHVSGMTWRTHRSPKGSARVTYQPVWFTDRPRERPYDIFVNGSADWSTRTLEDAEAYLKRRGYTLNLTPAALYPNDTDVKATSF